MIEHSHHDTKATFSKFLDSFVPISNVFIVADDILLGVAVEAMVGRIVDFTIGMASG